MNQPLSEKLRPKNLKDIVGQDHILKKEGLLWNSILSKKPLSLLFFGPPGCGKTTLAKLYAQSFPLPFFPLSAVFTSITDVKKLLSEAKETPLFSSKIILFVDEIHRFNKAQQDAFLPYIEDGSLILLGATTENPSFSLNNALLSRLRILQLNNLDKPELTNLLVRYESTHPPLPISDEGRKLLINLSGGDARHLYNLIENIENISHPIDDKELLIYLQRKAPLYDKSQDGHYSLISALHKSLRGSDPDASLYWLYRILQGGEDPLFICRRLIRMASEDIGLADPQALSVTLSAFKAYQILGSPEGELAIAEAVIYLALAPKSNALYLAEAEAKNLAKETSHLSPPPHIVNAPTNLMKELGLGKGYLYDHDCPNAFSGQNYFPQNIQRTSFYKPNLRGFEREMEKRLQYFLQLREKKEQTTEP
ncbi:MAG: replication-associated recombination protein A [Chlamydiota bacterium]